MTTPRYVVPTPYGLPCRDGWCVWESQAGDDSMDKATRTWAVMVSELCRSFLAVRPVGSSPI